MTDDIQLQVALALGLLLSPINRLKPVEQLVASVEREMNSNVTNGKAYTDVTPLARLDLSDRETVGFDDQVKLIKQLRRKGD